MDQRAGVVAVLDDLQQVALLLGQQWLRSPIVENEQIDAAELAYQLGVATVTASQCQRGKQPRDTLVEHRGIPPAGRAEARVCLPRRPGRLTLRCDAARMLRDGGATPTV